MRLIIMNTVIQYVHCVTAESSEQWKKIKIKLFRYFSVYRIDKKNVVSVYLYTATMGPWDLHVAAADFILQHFEQASTYNFKYI